LLERSSALQLYILKVNKHNNLTISKPLRGLTHGELNHRDGDENEHK